MCDAPDREAAMTVLRRDEDGRPTVWCDPCIAPLVDAVNAAGLTTVASCCGHGRRPGRIALADGRELFVAATYEQAQEVSATFSPISPYPETPRSTEVTA